MGAKLCELFEADNVTHRGWMFRCPACNSTHQIDDRWGFDGNVFMPTIEGSVLQSICTKSMKILDGDLHVIDLPGKGCVFTIDLPRA